MNKEKIDLLKNKYPQLFENVYCGISCEDGWFDLISQLSEKLTNICKKHNVIIRFAQIKNKFGLLRIYYDSEGEYSQDVSDHVYSLVNAVESMSGTICELCGQEGKKGGSAWAEVLCSNCREKFRSR